MTKLSKKVITFGCRLNNLESELIDQQLKQHSIDKNVFIFNRIRLHKAYSIIFLEYLNSRYPEIIVINKNIKPELISPYIK